MQVAPAISAGAMNKNLVANESQSHALPTLELVATVLYLHLVEQRYGMWPTPDLMHMQVSVGCRPTRPPVAAALHLPFPDDMIPQNRAECNSLRAQNERLTL